MDPSTFTARNLVRKAYIVAVICIATKLFNSMRKFPHINLLQIPFKWTHYYNQNGWSAYLTTSLQLWWNLKIKVSEKGLALIHVMLHFADTIQVTVQVTLCDFYLTVTCWLSTKPKRKWWGWHYAHYASVTNSSHPQFNNEPILVCFSFVGDFEQGKHGCVITELTRQETFGVTPGQRNREGWVKPG